MCMHEETVKTETVDTAFGTFSLTSKVATGRMGETETGRGCARNMDKRSCVHQSCSMGETEARAQLCLQHR